MDEAPCYKRVLLKLSGESFKGDQEFGIAEDIVLDIARQIKQIHRSGVQIAIVVGGGNYFRGVRSNTFGIDRTSADYMGMLATIMNGIAFRDVLENQGLEARLISALEIKAVAEPFNQKKVIRHLQKGRVVIFAAGTGSPYFTTDTAAALRAVEIKANVLLKATMVDGVYSDDPKKVPTAIRFHRISYREVLAKELKVLDSTAVTLCMENKLPIKIFDVTQPGNIINAITDERIGTTIYSDRLD
jgi:uridylate kinase